MEEGRKEGRQPAGPATRSSRSSAMEDIALPLTVGRPKPACVTIVGVTAKLVYGSLDL